MQRLKGKVDTFSSQTAALQPLLRVTLTPSFDDRQGKIQKKQYDGAENCGLRIENESNSYDRSDSSQGNTGAAKRPNLSAALFSWGCGETVDGRSMRLALALVPGTSKQLALLVLSHLLAALLYDAAQGRLPHPPKKGREKYWFAPAKSTRSNARPASAGCRNQLFRRSFGGAGRFRASDRLVPGIG